jgi:poly-gamma-glutamate synthesis protein (capsule biosynthesis protein)
MNIPDNGQIRLDGFAEHDLKILLTGDLCPVADVEDNFLAGKGEPVYGSMLPELHDKDLSITNLELALTRGGSPIDKCGPNLRASPAIVPQLATARFDVYGVANNHSRDWGDAAFLETLAHVEAAGARYVGGGRNAAEAALPLRLTVKGQRLAIFALTMHCDCDATEATPGANALNPPYNTLAIRDARAAGDFVVVIFHDGKEHVPFPARRIRNYCRAFIDAGACAVIGHHPHISRGFEFYRGAVIAYSLGNFLFPQRRETTATPPAFWFEGYCLRLRLGSAGITGLDVIPHRYDAARQCLEAVRDTAARQRFLARLNRLNAILTQPGENERYFSAAAASFSYYYQILRNFCNDMIEGSTDPKRAVENAKIVNHYLNCEEHWDVLDAVSLRHWHGATDVPADLKELY